MHKNTDQTQHIVCTMATMPPPEIDTRGFASIASHLFNFQSGMRPSILHSSPLRPLLRMCDVLSGDYSEDHMSNST